jgi:hypothetical protein
MWRASRADDSRRRGRGNSPAFPAWGPAPPAPVAQARARRARLRRALAPRPLRTRSTRRAPSRQDAGWLPAQLGGGDSSHHSLGGVRRRYQRRQMSMDYGAIFVRARSLVSAHSACGNQRDWASCLRGYRGPASAVTRRPRRDHGPDVMVPRAVTTTHWPSCRLTASTRPSPGSEPPGATTNMPP